MCRTWQVVSIPVVRYTEGNNSINEDASYLLRIQQDMLVSGLSGLSLYVQPPNKENLDKLCDGESTFSHEPGPCAISFPEKSVDTKTSSQVEPAVDTFGTGFRSFTVDGTSEDRPWEGQCMGASGSSLSLSLTETPADSVNSIESPPTDDSEVQSSSSGSADHPNSSEGLSPPRQGLSRFYGGKSRTFSCFSDVTSVKDLAKPKNPYARQGRKRVDYNSYLGNNAKGISKKASSKCTLALGMIMITEDLDDL